MLCIKARISRGQGAIIFYRLESAHETHPCFQVLFVTFFFTKKPPKSLLIFFCFFTPFHFSHVVACFLPFVRRVIFLFSCLGCWPSVPSFLLRPFNKPKKKSFIFTAVSFTMFTDIERKLCWVFVVVCFDLK